MTVVTLPVMMLRIQGHGATGLASMIDGGVFFLVILTQVLFYVVAVREIHPRWWRELRYLPFVPVVGVGLAVNNTRGVVEALLGHRSEFVRTPKLGVLGRDTASAKTRARTYVGARDVAQPLLEVLLGVYYVAMAFTQLQHRMYVTTIITFALSVGLFTMGGATLRSMFGGRRRAGAGTLPAGREVSPTPPTLPAAHPGPSAVMPVGVDA
jgi:hypothetical protein